MHYMRLGVRQFCYGKYLRRPPSSNLIFYDNIKNLIGSSDDLELTEGNSMDVVQKITQRGNGVLQLN